MQLPKYYEFYSPVKIVAGNKALENIPHELKLLQSKRPIIISDKGIEKAGLLENVIRGFDDSETVIGAVYTDTPVDSSIHAVNEIAALYRKEKCDSIIAVGGGSVIDTAKGVNIVVTEEATDIVKYSGADRLSKPQKPLMIIPTTAGTGSEVTSVAVISDPDKNLKMPFASQFLLPKVALLDPRMTISLPPRITAATGMDAMTHAVEAYTCIQKNPVSDAYATAAIRLISENLYKMVTDGNDEKGRFAMANASLMAGMAFSNSMVGAVHALGHAVGGIAHVPHGVAMSILLPRVMEYNMDKLSDLYAELLLPLVGEEVFVATPKEKRAVKSVAKLYEMINVLKQLCGHPTTLSEAGVTEDQLEKIAKMSINDGALINNPKEVELNDAMDILKKAF
ncbi:MAG: iron-containing alcohol dehydrogenase [Okeania sp. SIO3C4]|nr:iron-containing alcohol dehydrogenase [Okeania sp. SIO3C4]